MRKIKCNQKKEVLLEEKGNKYLNNIPQEFLIPRLSFMTEQTLSYFTRDVIDIIWKKYAERHHKTFHDIENYFMKLYQGKEKASRNNCECKYFSFTSSR